jgi:hypothetical protein
MVARAPARAGVHRIAAGKHFFAGCSGAGGARKVPPLIGFSTVMPYHRSALPGDSRLFGWQKTYF